jgi:hypothetical protein
MLDQLAKQFIGDELHQPQRTGNQSPAVHGLIRDQPLQPSDRQYYIRDDKSQQ